MASAGQRRLRNYSPSVRLLQKLEMECVPRGHPGKTTMTHTHPGKLKTHLTSHPSSKRLALNTQRTKKRANTNQSKSGEEGLQRFEALFAIQWPHMKRAADFGISICNCQFQLPHSIGCFMAFPGFPAIFTYRTCDMCGFGVIAPSLPRLPAGFEFLKLCPCMVTDICSQTGFLTIRRVHYAC